MIGVDAEQVTPIAILTLNPAVDMTYEVPSLLADQKVHALTSRLDPGGNGINVGRTLNRLGVAARNYCVVAGEVGQLLQRLLGEQAGDMHYEEVLGETRINVTAIERSPQLQYEISGIGPSIPTEQLESMLTRFVQHSVQGYGVLTGTMQNGLPEGLYADLARRIGELGGRAVVDSHDEVLRLAMDTAPFLIKPNRYEFETLLGKPLACLEAVASEARVLQRRGVHYVCVSLGEEGAVLAGPDNTYYAPAPKVSVRSSVGAGDTMVAALLAGFASGAPAEQALALAVACSAGTVTQPGTELFGLADLEKCRANIVVHRLDI